MASPTTRTTDNSHDNPADNPAGNPSRVLPGSDLAGDPDEWREARVRAQLEQARADAIARFGLRRERALAVAPAPRPNIVVATPPVPATVETTAAVVARANRPPLPDVSDDWVLQCIQAAKEAPRHVAGLGNGPRELAAAPVRPALPVARRDSEDLPDPGRNHTGPRPAILETEPASVIDLTDDLNDLNDELVVAIDQPAHDDAPTSTVPSMRKPSPTPARRLARLTRRVVKTAVGAVIAVLFLSQGALGILPIRTAYILTGSMSPGMPVGSLVVSRRVSATSVHPGDVITFPDPAKPGMEATHRVFATEKSAKGPVLVTKGDANAIPDPWRIPQRGHIWVRVASVRGLGFALGWLQAPAAHLVASLLPAFALAGWILIWLWRPVLRRMGEPTPAH